MGDGRFSLKLPVDARGVPIQLTPEGASKNSTYDSSITTATTITLNEDTSVVEITARVGGIFLKYGEDVSSSDFDEYIAAGATRHYVIPEEILVVSVIEADSGSEIILIEK